MSEVIRAAAIHTVTARERARSAPIDQAQVGGRIAVVLILIAGAIACIVSFGPLGR